MDLIIKTLDLIVEYVFQLEAYIIKTLNLKVEYVFQLKVYVNTWYLHVLSQRVWLRFSVKLYCKWEYQDF